MTRLSPVPPTKLDWSHDHCLCYAAGTISTSIYERIEKAWVVVADVTSGNGSVCYEVAYAHMKRKPTILLIQEGYKIPYDLRDVNCVTYAFADRNAAALRQSVPDLAKQLASIKIPVMMDNPILNADRVIRQRSEQVATSVHQVPPPPPPAANPLLLLGRPKPIESSGGWGTTQLATDLLGLGPTGWAKKQS